MNDLPELSGPIGSRLRQAREAQGLSVQYVSERLKFSARQVDALEAGDFSPFPHRTLLRGFVRAYARLLQLPETELLQMVDAEAPPDAPVPERPHLKGAVLHTRGRSRWPWRLTLVIVLMLACVGLGWLLYGWLQMSHLTRPPDPENQLLMESELTLPAQASAAQASAAAASAPVASAALPPAAVDGKAPLVLSFAEPAWVEVIDADGRSRYRALGAAKQDVAISGRAPFRITVGKATAVKVYFAGKAVDLAPHTRGEVARLTLPPAQ